MREYERLARTGEEARLAHFGQYIEGLTSGDFAIPLERVDDAVDFAFVQTYPGYPNFNSVY